jgi:hypothetical protein
MFHNKYFINTHLPTVCLRQFSKVPQRRDDPPPAQVYRRSSRGPAEGVRRRIRKLPEFRLQRSPGFPGMHFMNLRFG